MCLGGDGGEGGGGVDGSDGSGGVDGSGGNISVGDSSESIVYRSGEVVGVLCIGAVEVDWAGVVDILVLDGVFMVDVVEGVELVVGCVVRRVVRLAVWYVNGRGYLKSVEVNGLSVGGFLFGQMYCWTWWLLESLWWRLWMWCKCGSLSFSGTVVWGI